VLEWAGDGGKKLGELRRRSDSFDTVVVSPAADQFADLVNGFRREGVAVDFQALQVLGEPHLEAEDFQEKVGLLQQIVAFPPILGPEESFQQVVQVALDAFAEHKAVVAGELAGVVTGPQDEIVGLRDDDELFMSFTLCHVAKLQCTSVPCSFFIFDPLRGDG
jgi:hypothetical protein